MSAFFSRLLVVSLTSVLVLILGCSNPTKVTTPPLRTGAGVALLKILATPDSPFSRIADSATVTVSASDMITFTTALTVTDSSITGTITGIPAGTNRLFYVAVYDSYDTLQYRGSATANVFADSSVTLSLSITRVSGTAIVNGVITDGDVISTRGLVAYYPFNGGAKDVSGNGYNGVVNGAVLTTDRFGNANSAYYFNGTSSNITIPNNTSFVSQQFTICAWVKMSQVCDSGSNQFFISKGTDANAGGYFLSQNGPQFHFALIGAAGDKPILKTSNVYPSINTWYQLSASFDGNHMKIYLNGQLVGDTLVTGKTIGNSLSLTLGYQNLSYCCQFYLNGVIDDTRFYSRALTPGEIDLLYHENGWAGNTVSDIDGNVYHTVTIGTQTWMVENLKTTKYNDGTAIPLVTGNAAWTALTTPGRCYYNNDSATYKAMYGGLYNWYAVNTGKLAPTGWHVPTDVEWDTLIAFLGGTSVAGGEMKETGTAHWAASNAIATDSYGFSALPGGYRSDLTGAYSLLGTETGWWSTVIKDASFAWSTNLLNNAPETYRYFNYYKVGFSIRCLKGNPPISGFTTDSNTIALWRFNEGTGTAFSNVTGGAGTLNGGATWVDGKFGTAIKFNGTDGYGLCNFDPPENNCSYEMWFKPDTAMGSQFRQLWMGCMSFNGGPSVISDSIGISEFGFNEQRSAANQLTNQWNYIAMVISSTDSLQALYINGVKVSYLIASNKASFNWTSLLIGVSSSYACTNLSGYLKGTVDEFRVSNRARSAAEIQAVWIAGGGN